MIHDFDARALRLLDPEDAHGLTIRMLRDGLGPRDRSPAAPALATRIAGLDLPNCVGLAAGFDKDAEVPDAMLAMGFGFVECGTVTPLPQPGNPRPRLFRLAEDRGVINRFGFNSRGLDPFTEHLATRARIGVVGANIGANKDSPDRVADYVAGLERLWPLAEYFTVNISSPNTPGLRDLQGRAALDDLLGRLAEARAGLRIRGERPVFLKVAPDLDEAQIDDVCASAEAHGVDALIVSNTTLKRPDSLRSRHKDEAGGLSGRPLTGLSTYVLRLFRQRTKLPLIGCGGVSSGTDAYAKIRAGASAVQLYTALAYEGPGLVRRIKRDLAARLKADGFANVSEVVGAG